MVEREADEDEAEVVERNVGGQAYPTASRPARRRHSLSCFQPFWIASLAWLGAEPGETGKKELRIQEEIRKCTGREIKGREGYYGWMLGANLVG